MARVPEEIEEAMMGREEGGGGGGEFRARRWLRRPSSPVGGLDAERGGAGAGEVRRVSFGFEQHRASSSSRGSAGSYLPGDESAGGLASAAAAAERFFEEEGLGADEEEDGKVPARVQFPPRDGGGRRSSSRRGWRHSRGESRSSMASAMSDEGWVDEMDVDEDDDDDSNMPATAVAGAPTVSGATMFRRSDSAPPLGLYGASRLGFSGAVRRGGADPQVVARTHAAAGPLAPPSAPPVPGGTPVLGVARGPATAVAATAAAAAAAHNPSLPLGLSPTSAALSAQLQAASSLLTASGLGTAGFLRHHHTTSGSLQDLLLANLLTASAQPEIGFAGGALPLSGHGLAGATGTTAVSVPPPPDQSAVASLLPVLLEQEQQRQAASAAAAPIPAPESSSVASLLLRSVLQEQERQRQQQAAEAAAAAAVADSIASGRAAAIIVGAGAAQQFIQLMQQQQPPPAATTQQPPAAVGVSGVAAQPSILFPPPSATTAAAVGGAGVSHAGSTVAHPHHGGEGSAIAGAVGVQRPPPAAANVDTPIEIDLTAEDDEDDSSLTSFDGKHTGVSAATPQTPEERRVARAVHRAAETDDGALVAAVAASCPSAPRMLLGSEEPGSPLAYDVPAHVAARRGNLTALNCLLELDKDSALIRNGIGHTALHQAVEHGQFAAVQAICARVPACAKVQCDEGYLPLHDATSSGARHQDAPQITAALLSVFPGAVKITTDEGLLPIHLAAMSGFAAGIRTIFGYNFDTIGAKDNTELMLALDFATDGLAVCTGGRDGTETGFADTTLASLNGAMSNVDAQHEVLSVARQQPPTFSTAEDFEACIEILLMSDLYNRPIPMPRDESDDWPFLPIHAAIHARPLQRTWRFVFSYYGNHAADVGAKEQTPLHYLAAVATRDERTNVMMVNFLNSLYPDAAAQIDADGIVPLHHALLNPLSTYGFVKAILDCYGAAVTMEVPHDSGLRQRRGFLPFQMAAASGHGVDVINMLLRTHPMGVKSGAT